MKINCDWSIEATLDDRHLDLVIVVDLIEEMRLDVIDQQLDLRHFKLVCECFLSVVKNGLQLEVFIFGGKCSLLQLANVKRVVYEAENLVEL